MSVSIIFICCEEPELIINPLKKLNYFIMQLVNVNFNDPLGMNKKE